MLCRDRGVTMLLRVDVSTSSSGALLVTLSDQAAGFAPYRVDNCTSQTLHLRFHAHPASSASSARFRSHSTSADLISIS